VVAVQVAVHQAQLVQAAVQKHRQPQQTQAVVVVVAQTQLIMLAHQALSLFVMQTHSQQLLQQLDHQRQSHQVDTDTTHGLEAGA
jgi:hypothetical protein